MTSTAVLAVAILIAGARAESASSSPAAYERATKDPSVDSISVAAERIDAD
jgi:hypothetical protein